MAAKPAKLGAGLKAITANRLVDGAVLFQTVSYGWTAHVQQAAAWNDAALADALLKAQADHDARMIVEPYPIEVTQDIAGVTPQRYRERVRALGPSVRADLGYQAQSGAPSFTHETA
jgi:hypothetical protein